MIANYFIHLRAKSFIPSFMFALTGYAVNPNKGTLASIPIEILCLFVLYSVLLFGGTCALNSHFDKDTGPLNFLEDPPEKPKYLGWFGFFVMVLGCVMAWYMGLMVFKTAVASTVLSILYSVKIPGIKWRGKEIGTLDNLINALGCGFIGVVMGATVGHGELTLPLVILGIGFTITVMGSYPATQLFQLKGNDEYEIARNFTTLLGPTPALKVGVGLLLVGLLFVNSVQFLFFDFQKNVISLVLFFGFNAFFLLGVRQVWQWSSSPHHETQKKYKALVGTLLGARILWIAAEWIIV